MTTIRDLLNDFADEVFIQGSAMAWNQDTITPEERNAEIEPRIEELIELIKERIIG